MLPVVSSAASAESISLLATPKASDGLVVKVGALEDPLMFGGPTMVFWAQEKQTFHVVPDGIATFATLPGCGA